MIEDRFVHQSPFEYEYEYRFTEYEYDEDRNAFMPERLKSPRPAGCDFPSSLTRPAAPWISLFLAFLRTRTQHRGTRTRTRSSDTVSVRWINRVSIDTIRLRSDLPRRFDSTSIASQTTSTS